jgi:hypothetical protein
MNHSERFIYCTKKIIMIVTDAKLGMSCRNLCTKSGDYCFFHVNSYRIFPDIGQLYLCDNSLSQSSVVWKILLQNMFDFVCDYKAACSFSVDKLGKDSLQLRTFSSKFNRTWWLRRWKQAMETITCQEINGRTQTVTFLMLHLMFTKCLTFISLFFYLSILLQNFLSDRHIL